MAFFFGYRTGLGWHHAEETAATTAKRIKEDKIESQVKRLVEMAYPSERRVAFVISIPPANIAEEIEAHKNSPAVVRAILYQEVDKEETQFALDFGKGLTKANREKFWNTTGKAAFDEYQRRLLELRDWNPDKYLSDN